MTKAQDEKKAAEAEAQAAEQTAQDDSSKDSTPAAPVQTDVPTVDGHPDPAAPAGPGDVPVSERPEYAFLEDAKPSDDE